MKTSPPRSAYLRWLSRVLPLGSAGRPALTYGDLVLGYATGYDAATIAPFVRSLRAVYDAEAVLVVDDRPDVLDLLKAHAIHAVHPQPRRGWEPHVAVARFGAFADLLERRGGPGCVLLTDVRDVVFQGDPFHPRPSGLEVFVENEDGRLGDHAFNMKHLAALVGEEMAAGLADRPCICIGTIMGPRDEVARLCRLILMLAAVPRSQVGGAFGADQAAGNLAVHLDLAPARLQANFGRVATVGLTGGERLRFADGLIFNPEGDVSPIVHQYDRHPELAGPIHALWAGDQRRCVRKTRRTAAEGTRRIGRSLMRRMPELR